jgi:hypothetical protein
MYRASHTASFGPIAATSRRRPGLPVSDGMVPAVVRAASGILVSCSPARSKAVSGDQAIGLSTILALGL